MGSLWIAQDASLKMFRSKCFAQNVSLKMDRSKWIAQSVSLKMDRSKCFAQNVSLKQLEPTQPIATSVFSFHKRESIPFCTF